MMIRITTLLALFLFIFEISYSQSNGAQLFRFTDEVSTEWAAKSTGDLERAPIEFDYTLLYEMKDGYVELFQIETITEDLFEVEISRVIEHYNGDWSIIGNINGSWINSFTLSYSDGKILSSIQNIESHEFYEIVFSTQEQLHSFIKVNPHEKDELSCGVHDDLEVNSSYKFGQLSKEQVAQDTTHIVDVMIVYTQRARAWGDFDRGGINNVINQSMATAQLAIDNSDIDMEFRLVHSAQVDYRESGSCGTDLRRLTASQTFNPFGDQFQGYIEEVHEWRDIHKADLVAMFTETTDCGGIAWLLRNEQGDPRFGFSLTRVQQAEGLTHAHELGHNMGSHHSRNQQSNAAGADGGLFPYSTGWRWTGTNGQGITSTMTYGEGDARAAIFSNPDILVQGEPAGSYTEEFAPADNARSLREIKQVVSLYREAIGIPEVQLNGITNITAGSAEASVTVVDRGNTPIRSQGVCWSATPNPSVTDLCVNTFFTSDSNFSLEIPGLNGNTNYYVRAYATNSGGTGYSENQQFRTNDISRNNSTVTATRNKVLATGQQESTIEVRVINSNFNPVEGIEVILDEEGGLSNITAINAITNIEGIARFTVTNTTEETVTYSAVADNLVLNSKVEVEYLFSNPETTLGNNYPNPFNNQTVIPIVIPEDSRVRIDIFNVSGARVRTIFDEQVNVGYYEIPFDATGLASGMYFYRLTTNQEMLVEKLLLLK